MTCRNRISDRCGKRSSSVCVDYEGTLREGTVLDPLDCLSVQDVIEDINDGIDKLKSDTTLDNLSSTCIDYPQVGDNLTVKEAIKGLETKLEQVMDFVGMGCDNCPSCNDCPKVFTDSIACLDLNYGVLVDACGNQPTNLKEVLQLILDNLQP